MWSLARYFNYHNSLKSNLEPGEISEADDGYIGEALEFIECPKSFGNPQETLFMQQRVENRNEIINKCMKNWGVLKKVYCHQFDFHGEEFCTIAVVT